MKDGEKAFSEMLMLRLTSTIVQIVARLETNT